MDASEPGTESGSSPIPFGTVLKTRVASLDKVLPGPASRSAGESVDGRVRIGNTWFDNLTMAQAISRIDALVQTKVPAVVVTPNLDHVVRSQKDRGYANLVRMADLVLADGQPIVWGSRLLGTPLKERVAGSDLFPQLCEHAARVGHRVFFLGGDPEAAETARTVLERRFPGLQVVGTHCPPIGFERSESQNHRAIEVVREAKPDIVFVGLGSPKQERWIVSNRGRLGPVVGIGVGVSFSFVAGQVRRAPKWMRRLGLEWLHRLYMEPRRLWKRYLVDVWAIMPIALRDIFRTYLARGHSASRRRASNTS